MIDTVSKSMQHEHERVASGIDAKFGRSPSAVTFAINNIVGLSRQAIDRLTEEFSLGSLAVMPFWSSSRGPSSTWEPVHCLSIVIRCGCY